MTDTSDTPPEPEMRTEKPPIWRRLSLVWLVPLIALAVSGWVVVKTFSEQGRLIEIAFDEASGVRAGETQLRYRDVVVGLVEEVRFTEDLTEVLVAVRLDPQVSPFIDEDAQFWIVSPQVSAQGVSGLDTVLSGVYIEGSWNNSSGEIADRFEGLDTAPLRQYGREGLAFTLRASSVAGLSENAPILYKGITVGQVGNIRLADDGVSIIADAFVRAPEARLINSATRFWDTSGFSFRFGAQGATLDVNSLASLVSGGVAFDTTVSGGQPVDETAIFRLYADEESARSSVFAGSNADRVVNFTVIFEDSVPGLEVGADVEFSGINVGRVAALTGVMDAERFGDRGVRLLVTLEMQPGKMGLDPDASPEEVLDFMTFAVQNGLRAQLQSASLLGGLQVVLDTFQNIPPATIEGDAEPYPRIPSIPADLSDFADTAEGVFNRVNALPIEELLDGAINVMASVERLLNSEGVLETPTEVLGLLGDVRALVNSEGIQTIPSQVSGALGALQGTAEQLEGIVTQLTEANAVEQLTTALEAAEEAADSVFETMDGGPETLAQVNEAIEELTTLIATVNRLPLESVVAETEGSIAALRALLASEATQGITGDVSLLLTQVEGLVADVRGAGLVETANATLTQLQLTVAALTAQIAPLIEDARDAIVAAQQGAERLPDVMANVESLTAELSALAAEVRGLPIEGIVADAQASLAGVRTLIQSEATQGIPSNVSTLLGTVEGLVRQVSQSGVIESSNAAVNQVEQSLQSLTAELTPLLAQTREGTARLPAVIANVEALTEELTGLAQEVRGLPVEGLVADAQASVASVRALIESEATQGIPNEVSGLVATIEALVRQVSQSGLIETSNAAVNQVDQSLQALTAELAPLLAETRASVPDLLAQIDAIAAQVEALVGNVNALPLQSVVNNVDGLLVSVRSLVNQPGTQDLPATAVSTLNAVEALLTELNESAVVEQAVSTLAATETALIEITESLQPVLREAQRAAAQVAQATDVVPEIAQRAQEIADQIEALVSEASTLPLEEIGARVNDLLASTDALVSSEDTQRVPGALADTLEEVQRLLIEVQEGGLIESANATLASAARAADAVATSTEALPVVLGRVSVLLGEVEGVIAGYDAQGQLGVETRATLRQIQDAARSVDALARQIQRAPNSLLFGR